MDIHFFLQEMKPISFWAAVYSAYNIGFVFDLSAGSGAQAIAAAQVGIGYRGVCANEKHMKWLNSLLEKAILAVEAESKTGKGEDQEYTSKLAIHPRYPETVHREFAPILCYYGAVQHDLGDTPAPL